MLKKYILIALFIGCCSPLIASDDTNEWGKALASTPVVAKVEHPLAPAIPDIARGNEEIYLRFISGSLIYKPNPESDVGRVDVPIASLTDPLAGTFDLSRFGDTGNYISIHTGYKKAKIAANSGKTEIWVCPKFLAERELDGTASQFRPIMGQWESPIAYFWTWGRYDVAADNFDYLLTPDVCNNNELNLYDKWRESTIATRVSGALGGILLMQHIATRKLLFKF